MLNPDAVQAVLLDVFGRMLECDEDKVRNEAKLEKIAEGELREARKK